MWKADGCVDVAKGWLYQENLGLELEKDQGNSCEMYVCVENSLLLNFSLYQLLHTHKFCNLIKKKYLLS